LGNLLKKNVASYQIECDDLVFKKWWPGFKK